MEVKEMLVRGQLRKCGVPVPEKITEQTAATTLYWLRISGLEMIPADLTAKEYARIWNELVGRKFS